MKAATSARKASTTRSISEAPRRRTNTKAAPPQGFEQIFLLPPHERVNAIKEGVPAKRVGVLAGCMDMTTAVLLETLGLARATVTRKVRQDDSLSVDESERVLGIESLIGQVAAMVRESGDPNDFDAAKWVSVWLTTPLAALGGKTPASYMDTVEGQKLVSNLLATAQSGAYA
jgi:putative toxin-antitoxin system antitoxin component (TIGR02293 family)